MTAPTAPTVLAPDTIRKLNELAIRWTDVGAAERANYSLYLIELCEAIGVERPRRLPMWKADGSRASDRGAPTTIPRKSGHNAHD